MQTSFDADLLALLTEDERRELIGLITNNEPMWRPLAGPQSMAYYSTADIVGYGGAAGGGKTDLACGKATTQHRKAMILRRVGTELTGINDRLEELVGSRDGYNGKDNIWRLPNVQIELGAVPNAGDERKYQGRPHDLLVFDEATNFLVTQIRFLLGWLRTTVPGQRCQALFTFNPPTSAEGRWVIEFFAPWLDAKFPNPAQPGELRYAASLPAGPLHPNGRDLWVDGPAPFVLVEGVPCYEFNPKDYAPDDIITPLSRTFIPSRISDNPYLLGTGYMSQLQSLPEPLRSQMLKGDFAAGMEDDPWQVIPTEWVELAQARWKPRMPKPKMDSLGVDVARGGKDNSILAPRHGMWFDEMTVIPGRDTPDGPSLAGRVIAVIRNRAVIHIDVIGVGASPYDFLRQAQQHIIGVNVAEKATGNDRSGRLRFRNQRSQLWWNLREALDPMANNGIELPPSPQLLADLCAPKWRLVGETIEVESRDEIIARIHRSPDWGSAAVLALMNTPTMDMLRSAGPDNREHDPFSAMNQPSSYQGHDPYA